MLPEAKSGSRLRAKSKTAEQAPRTGSNGRSSGTVSRFILDYGIVCYIIVYYVILCYST